MSDMSKQDRSWFKDNRERVMRRRPSDKAELEAFGCPDEQGVPMTLVLEVSPGVFAKKVYFDPQYFWGRGEAFYEDDILLFHMWVTLDEQLTFAGKHPSGISAYDLTGLKAAKDLRNRRLH